jgi:Asp-tRNA(Asn)/Glu-tRNA(Gln) amidotransferase A subunit family amidase
MLASLVSEPVKVLFQLEEVRLLFLPPILHQLGTVMPFYPARDSAGPITRHASDLAYAMNAIAQRDSKNPHWDSKAPKTPDFTKSMIGHLKGLRVGVIDQGVKPDKGSAEEQFVYDVYAEQNRRLKALGATMVKADLPHELVEALSDNVPGQNATVRSTVVEEKQS